MRFGAYHPSDSMSRRNVVWLITLPLAIVGSQVAHAAGYRLATGEGELAHALASSGHGYLAYAPLALGVCAAFVVLVAICFWVYYPIYVGDSIPYDQWYKRMLLGNRWV